MGRLAAGWRRGSWPCRSGRRRPVIGHGPGLLPHDPGRRPPGDLGCGDGVFIRAPRAAHL